MVGIISSLKLKAKQLRGFFPSKLPSQGIAELENFTTDIITTYALPDLPSYRHAVATMIMHLDPLTNYKAKVYFAKSIRKAMSNQIAYEQIQRIKALEEKQKAEDLAPETSSDQTAAIPN